MSAFNETVQHERTRLATLISEARDKIAELQDQVAADEQRIEALDAYDRVRVGKTTAKGSKKVSRRPRSAPLDGSPEEPANE